MGEEEEEATTTTTTTDKVTFFKELDKLDDLTDSQDQDEDDFAHLIALSKRKAAQADSVDALVPTSSSSSAAVNTTTPRANTSIQSSSQSVPGPEQEQNEEMARKPALKSAKTTGNIEEKPEGPPVKRRRTYAARTIPEQQQVFKGLVFCEFPQCLFVLALIKC